MFAGFQGSYTGPSVLLAGLNIHSNNTYVGYKFCKKYRKALKKHFLINKLAVLHLAK